MCVTRSRTTSFLISGDNFFSSMAAIIEGLHLVGIVKFKKPLSVGESAGDATLLGTEMVETSDRLGEGESMQGGEPTSTCCEDGIKPSGDAFWEGTVI